MVVRLNKGAHLDTVKNKHEAIGVEGDPSSLPGKISEVEKLVGDAKRKVQAEGIPGVGISGSNSGKGHDSAVPKEDEAFSRVSMEKVVEEEPGLTDEADTPEMAVDGVTEIEPEVRKTLTKGIPKEA